MPEVKSGYEGSLLPCYSGLSVIVDLLQSNHQRGASLEINKQLGEEKSVCGNISKLSRSSDHTLGVDRRWIYRGTKFQIQIEYNLDLLILVCCNGDGHDREAASHMPAENANFQCSLLPCYSCLSVIVDLLQSTPVPSYQ